MLSHYLDINISAREWQPRLSACTKVFSKLHGLFKSCKEHTYALGFPTKGEKYQFNKIRVFSSQEALEALKERLSLPDASSMGDIQNVPAGGPWVSYKYYRVPSHNTVRNGNREQVVKNAQRRVGRLDFSDENCFHFNVKSKSNGYSFKRHINVVKNAEPSVEIAPDSYGLAVTTRPFSVPDLPF